MPYWETKVFTYNPKTNERATFEGDDIYAPSRKMAQMWLNSNGKGYMKTTGRKSEYEVDAKTGKATYLGYFDQN